MRWMSHNGITGVQIGIFWGTGAVWILEDSIWNDAGEWNDTAVWSD